VNLLAFFKQHSSARTPLSLGEGLGERYWERGKDLGRLIEENLSPVLYRSSPLPGEGKKIWED